MRGQLGDGRLRLFGSHAVHVCERLLWLGRHAVQLCVTREQAPPGARDRHAPPAPLTVGRGGSGGRLPCGGAMCGVCAGVYFFFVSVSVPHLRLELVLPHQQPVGLHLPGWLHRCGQHRLQRYDSPSRRMASSRSVRTDTTEHGLTRTPPWLARWWVDARLRLSRSARRHARLISLEHVQVRGWQRDLHAVHAQQRDAADWLDLLEPVPMRTRLYRGRLGVHRYGFEVYSAVRRRPAGRRRGSTHGRERLQDAAPSFC